MKPTCLTLLCAAASLAQPNPQQIKTWFPPDQLMTIGVYYYPEAWPESQWERDIANIKKFGFEYIHLAEFAWAFMEPTEGNYQFGWLDRVIAIAQRNGLKVVLCTPSAAPPVWLSRNHPETLMVDSNGRRMDHGSREQGDWNSPVFRQYVERIDAKMAERYGTNPNVWGWQIDNELSHYGAGVSYAPAAQTTFRAWLREKYGTIDRLNADWGNAFWSQMYGSFDQIDLPNQKELVAAANPHALLDLRRWFAEEAADYLRFQAAVLRRYVKNQWVTTNFMSSFDQVNPALSEKDLDIMSFTMYPVRGNLEMGELGFRMGNNALIAFMHDFLKNLGSGIEGPMELQPGQVNWAPVNSWPLPGVVHSWIMLAFAQGGRLVCTYRYRQPLFGDEQYHKTIVEPDGVTLAPGGKEFVQAIQEVQALRRLYKPDAPEPADYASRRTAFLNSFENRWDIDNHPQTYRWNTMDHWMKYYRALKSVMAPVDVLTENRDFSKYRYLIAPSYQMIDKDLVARFTSYAENGGTLILTSRTGQMDRRGHIWETLWAEPIYDLIGAAIPKYDVLPNGRNGKVTAGGKTYEWGSWGDIIEPRPGTEVLATYADQFYKGSAAAISRRLGKGRVVYIGVDTLTGDLEADLIRSIYGRTPGLPLNFFVDWRDGFWTALNFTDAAQPIPAPATAKILSGKRVVPPGDTTIWQ
jgi:beta-galactosidase